MEKKERNINLDIDSEVAQGAYANLAMSNFNKEEFILDYAFIQPGADKGTVRSRVILSPRNAKKLAQMLTKNIENYEKKFGALDENTELPGITFSAN